MVAQNPNWPIDQPNSPVQSLSLPENMPGDPDYRPNEDCKGQHVLFSFTPSCAEFIAESQTDIGLGIHADHAWLFTTGYPEVRLAVLGDGIAWDDVELVGRWALNSSELPVPVTSTQSTNALHDRNQDGAFTVLDYTSATGTVAPTRDLILDARLLMRPDRGDANKNGVLDPEDLILIFSDGIDDDQNGKVDDICGWDFVANDANVSTSTSSKTTIPDDNRRARVMVAEANNGVAGLGVCPNCLVVPIRVGDKQSRHNAHLVNGLRYAAELGLDVVNLGTIPNANSQREQQEISQAIADLREKNTFVVVDAGNQRRAEFNFPWNSAATLTVGALSNDHFDLTQATTAFGVSPCSNFGPSVDAVAPGDCKGLAASLASGTAGLILSAAQGISRLGVDALQIPLRPEEIKQIINMSATHRPEEDSSDPKIRARFRKTHSYGRINARAAVQAVVQRNIAPIVRITSPGNYDHIDPTLGQAFMVGARIENLRHESADWVLEYALGTDAATEDFLQVSRGIIRKGEAIDVVGEIPSNALFTDPTAPPFDEFTHALTLRVSANVDVDGSVARSEARRIVFVHSDLYLLPGFPKRLESAPASPAVFVDLNQDGKDEAVVVDRSGQISAFDDKGQSVPAWPRTLSLSNSPVAMSFGVLEPAGPGCFVITAVDGSTDIIDVQGERKQGFPVALSSSTAIEVIHPPVLYDLDGDDTLEIIVAGTRGYIMAWNHEGKSMLGFPIELGQSIGPLAAGHFGTASQPGIVAVSANGIHLIQSNSDQWFEVTQTQTIIKDEPTAQDIRPLGGAVAVDLDANGNDEIMFLGLDGRVHHFDPSTGIIDVRSLHDRVNFGTGTSISKEGDSIYAVTGPSSLGDLDQDGRVDFIHPAATEAFENFQFTGPLMKSEFLIAAWNSDSGSMPRSFPILGYSRQTIPALVIDLDRDRRPELIFSDGRFRIQARSSAGVSPKGWPKAIDGPLVGPLTVGDIDGDQRQELLATTTKGTLFVWRSLMRNDAIQQWPYARHDLQATANYQTPLDSDERRKQPGSCDCRNVDSTHTQALDIVWLAALVLISFGFRPRDAYGRLRH
jgi:hypothetical protein